MGEEGNKPSRLGISEPISIISSEDYEDEDRSVSHKKSANYADKDKDDKAILSSLPVAMVKALDGYEGQIGEADPLPNSYVRFMERSGEELDGIQFCKNF